LAVAGGGDGEVMSIGVMLLDQVEWHYGRESNEYCNAEALVRNVFKMFHGILTRDVFMALVSSYSKLHDCVTDKELLESMGDLYEALMQLQETLTKNISQFQQLHEIVHHQSPYQEMHQGEAYDTDHDDLILEFLSHIQL
jgi:hypothetical protein